MKYVITLFLLVLIAMCAVRVHTILASCGTPVPTPSGNGISIDLNSNVGMSNVDAFGGNGYVNGAVGLGLTNMRQAEFFQNIVPNTSIATYKACMSSNGNDGIGSGGVCDPNTWNWNGDSSSSSIQNARSAGAHIMLIVGSSTSWDTSGPVDGGDYGPPNTTDGWTVYDDIVKKYYQHNAPMNQVEVWNEPDGNWFVDPSTYQTLFSNVYNIIRSIDSNVAIGGPAVSTPSAVPTYADAIHSTGITPNFFSFHSYSASVNEDIGARNYVRGYWPNVPIYVTEWNVDGSCTASLDGDDPQSVGWAGSRLISEFALGYGADYYSINNGGGATCNGWYNGSTPFPKVYAWYLMSKQLGLGAGPAQIKNSNQTGLSTATGAVNSAGDPVAILGLWSGGETVTVTFNNLAVHSWNLQLFIADHISNNATSALDNRTVTPNSSGQLSYTFNMTDYSVAGVMLIPGGPAPTRAPTPAPTPTPPPPPSSNGVTIDFNSPVITGQVGALGAEALSPTFSTAQVTVQNGVASQMTDMYPGNVLQQSGTGEGPYATCMNSNGNDGIGSGGVCDPNTWNWGAQSNLAPRLSYTSSLGTRIQWEILYGEPNGWSGCTQQTSNFGNPLCAPNNWAVWEDIVTKYAQHFVGIYGWPDWIQFGSEPDLGAGLTLYYGPADYATYYYHMAHAIRQLNGSIPLAGPVTQSGTVTLGSYAAAMVNQGCGGNCPIPASWVNIGAYHDYTSAGSEDPAFAQNFHQYYPGVPMAITEWNVDGACTNPQDGDSYLGYVGSRLISFYQTGAWSEYYAWNNIAPTCDSWVNNGSAPYNNNNTPYAKIGAWYILGIDLGLAAGNGTVYASSTTGLSGGMGVINSAGNPVAALSNYGNGGTTTVTVTFEHLPTHSGAWTANAYVADNVSNNGHSPIATGTLSANQFTFTMTANSIAGVILH